MKLPHLILRPVLLSLLILGATSRRAAADAAEPAGFPAARALFEARKDDEAQAAFAKLAAENPKFAAGQFHLGLLALRRNDPEAAVPRFLKATELEPSSVSYQLRLGDAYGMSAAKAGLFSKLGLAKKCRAQYEKAVALDPKSVEARWSLMEYFKQAPGIAGGSFAHAHEQADAIAAFNPGAGRFAKAGVFAAEKKFDEAFAPYAGAVHAEPPDYSKLNQLGQLAMNTGQRKDEGIQALKKCLTMTPPPWEPGHVVIHAIIGRLHEMAGDKSAARAAYAAALALDANFKPAADALAKLK